MPFRLGGVIMLHLFPFMKGLGVLIIRSLLDVMIASTGIRIVAVEEALSRSSYKESATSGI